MKPGLMLLANRGYDAFWIRELAMKKGAWANIAPKSNRSEPIYFSPYLYRARNRVEWFFNRIKQCRGAATRHDRLAANYLAFVQLASIRLWLGANESTSQHLGTARDFIIPPRNPPIGAERGRLHPALIIALPGGNGTCRKAMIRETRGRSSVSPDH
jgi:transposase